MKVIPLSPSSFLSFSRIGAGRQRRTAARGRRAPRCCPYSLVHIPPLSDHGGKVLRALLPSPLTASSSVPGRRGGVRTLAWNGERWPGPDRRLPSLGLSILSLLRCASASAASRKSCCCATGGPLGHLHCHCCQADDPSAWGEGFRSDVLK